MANSAWFVSVWAAWFSSNSLFPFPGHQTGKRVNWESVAPFIFQLWYCTVYSNPSPEHLDAGASASFPPLHTTGCMLPYPSREGPGQEGGRSWSFDPGTPCPDPGWYLVWLAPDLWCLPPWGTLRLYLPPECLPPWQLSMLLQMTSHSGYQCHWVGHLHSNIVTSYPPANPIFRFAMDPSF